MDMEDAQIIELFWNRDENAISALDNKYNQFCFSIAWKLLSNKEDSEECVNDTWFTAWRSIPPKKPSKLSIFLGKITRGFAIDMLRKRYAAKRTDNHIIDITDEVMELNNLITYDFEENISAEELINIINRFLGELSPKSRDIFIQRYWHTETIKNISIRHRMSEGAVKQNIRRTKRKLLSVLKSEERV